MTFLRTVGAVAAGLFVAFILVIAVELFSAVVHPTPPDFDGSMEQMCQHVENYPQWVLAVVVPMWAATALAGTWIAGRLGNLTGAIIVGLLLSAAAISNVAMLPYPLWFKIAVLLAIPAAAAAGVHWSRRRETPAVNIAE